MTPSEKPLTEIVCINFSFIYLSENIQWEKRMLEKLLMICCYFDYHPKTRLMDVKIGFGPSGKIEKVECKICKKVYIRDKKGIDLTMVLIVILLLFLFMLLF